ncbi:MAG: penicillin-binding protein [Streptococcaceae bacterium]|jgi:penicillin-binding protein 2X|nr:penicillin-binding protein [Streptococcaceae bacterium]
MLKFLKKLLPFERIKKRAEKTKLPAYDNRRHVARGLFLVALSFFMLIVLRLSWLVAANEVGGTNLAQAAKNNYTYTQTDYPQRGTIYDRFGTPLAMDSSTYTIYVNLNKSAIDQTTNEKLYAPSDTFSKLSDFLNTELGIDKTLSMTQLTLKGAMQVQFGTNGTKISFDKKAEIIKNAASAGLTGIGFSADLNRSYPNGVFASNLIGQATLKTPGDNSSGLVGLSGMEASFNSILSGKPGIETIEKDKGGTPIPGAIISKTPAVNGKDVYTTLDAKLQNYLEQLIDKAYKDSKGQQVSATLMNAKTGEILATSQRPTYNPQTGQKTSTDNYTDNSWLYQTAYEPGSTMKTFLTVSAIDSGHFNANATYQRKLHVYDVDINDWDINEYNNYMLPSTVTAAQGFAMSSNTVMSQVEMQMGNTIWNNYLNRFDFGRRVRFGLGYETTGSLPTSNLVNQIQSSFGQGIAVSQIQLLRAWTSFANKGAMLEPHVISQIYNPNDQTTLLSEPEVIGKPLKAASVAQELPLMVSVGTDTTFGTANKSLFKNSGGTGSYFVTNGVADAVKTGTAQIAAPNGGYLEGKNDTLNSVVAMYPPKDPDFIIYLTNKIPQNSSLDVTATLVNSLMTRAESEKSFIDTTSNNINAGKVTMPDYKSKSVGPAADELRQDLLAPVILGDGNNVFKQSVSAGKKIGANTRVLLLTDGAHTMPDMYGWSQSDVETLAKWYNLSVTFEGGKKDKNGKIIGGSVTDQSIADNVTTKSGNKLTVTLGDS